MEKKTIGAWKKQTSKGEVISFTIEGKKYSMWVNTYKKEEKHPDFNIVEDKPFEKKIMGMPYTVKANKPNQSEDNELLPF
jgi:hypothetical protein